MAFDDLRTRTVSGLALALVSVTLFALGGLWSAALLAVGAGAMVWELRAMILGEKAARNGPAALAIGASAAALFVTEATELRWGVALAGTACAVLFLLEGARGRIAAVGTFYIALSMMCIEGLRDDPAYGFEAVVWLVLVVIGADVGGYFAGRILGGPKLWPRVSPKKTWSGFLGGLALAALFGAAFSALTEETFALKVMLVSILVAAVSVGGDLLESAMKRHYGVKDSSGLLPGHGGVLDRLDGLMAAALVAGAITFARGTSVFVW